MKDEAKNPRNPIMFFDLETTGHHVEYLYHIMQYWKEESQERDAVLITHPDYFDIQKPIGNKSEKNNNRLYVFCPSKEEIKYLLTEKSIINKGSKIVQIAKRFASKYSATHCYMMALNPLQLALGQQLSHGFPCNIRGILFNPYPALDFGDSVANKCKTYLTYTRKYLQITWMLRNKSIDRIYILNDSHTANILNKLHQKKNLFQSLTDPILIPPDYNKNMVIKYRKNHGKIRFLLFGSLSSRKGIFTLLEALEMLPKDIAKGIEVVFAGKVASDSKKRFYSTVTSLKKTKHDLELEIVDRFIPYSQISNLFMKSDCVLLPYSSETTGSSSGVIGHSALYCKPVIGPKRGLIGKLIRKYNLGMDIEPVDPPKIAEAIIDFVEKGRQSMEHDGMERFVEERTPKKFVKTLIF